jgi:D-alanyl-D-alanine dipeptidase
MIRIIFALSAFLVHLLYAQSQMAESALEKELRQAGLVNVQEMDSTLVVDLRYSSPNNFMHADVYGDLNHAYLQREVALMLAQAQKHLKEKAPGYSLLILDGARPRRVQYKMWEIVKGTAMQSYVANPAKGSIHNYGAAVDLTIVDENGKELDMGTPYDFFGDLAQPILEEKYLAEGRLTAQQVANRKLLREVMAKAGFKPLNNEWWHFDAFPRAVVAKKFKIIE